MTITDAGGDGTVGKTAEELGYQDAMRQVQRSLQRRLKGLQDELKDASAAQQRDILVRISEVEHIQQVVESLHR